jgi:hypothetical protein
MKDNTSKYKPVANPVYARAIAELRRSGASGTHNDKRTKRQRTRQAQLDKAIKDQSM